MPTRTRSIRRARSEGYLETVKAQKKNRIFRRSARKN